MSDQNYDEQNSDLTISNILSRLGLNMRINGQDSQNVQEFELFDFFEMEGGGLVIQFHSDVNPSFERVTELCQLVLSKASEQSNYYGQSINLSFHTQCYPIIPPLLIGYMTMFFDEHLNEFQECINDVNVLVSNIENAMEVNRFNDYFNEIDTSPIFEPPYTTVVSQTLFLQR